MFHNNLHVDYYLCPRDNFKQGFLKSFQCLDITLVISEQSDTGRK